MKANRFSLARRLFRLRRLCPAGTLAAAIGLASAGLVLADDSASTNAPAATVSNAQPAAKPDKKSGQAAKKVSGVELYAIHCNRCHQERYPTERTGAQWRTIMLHMQIRANIPATQARLILQYLQEEAAD